MMTSPGRHETIKKGMDQISNVTKRYVGGVVTVVLILCVLNSVGLMIVGLQYAMGYRKFLPSMTNTKKTIIPSSPRIILTINGIFEGIRN